jgi:hypothetical protein
MGAEAKKREWITGNAKRFEQLGDEFVPVPNSRADESTIAVCVLAEAFCRCFQRSLKENGRPVV